ncbi:MAG: DNA double-strand break repair nuclease NurA [Gammaproteobacteria bacterium]
MPFENERASYSPLRRILQSEKVRRLQERFRLAKSAGDEGEPPQYESSPGTNNRQPDFVLAVDGGYHTTPIDTGYPGAEVGYITVAAVLILLDKLREVAADDIINPVEYRKTQKRSSIDTVLPGRGVIIDDERSPEASMRKTLFEEMAGYRVFDDSESMLETYQALMKNAPNDERARCPCDKGERYHRGVGKYVCESCDFPLYSTDAMRLHELFSPHERGDKMYGHVMSTLERLWLVHVLRAFERRGKEWLSIIGRMAFILDGPLAVYGTPAWLSAPIRTELTRINDAQKRLTKTDMMILGVEKSGAFVRHFEMLDARGDDGVSRFVTGMHLRLTDDYIRKHIVPSSEGRQYGRNTYFGRKLLCKTALGHRIVASIACFTEEQRDLSSASPEQFPRLADALALFDKLSSNLYPNSISPLIVAHSEAAIPLNLGGQILEDIAKKAVADA